MSKAVLMSIQPQWVEKIASGEKTIEVRKTKPKLETPFKCYIYETYDKKYANTGVYWFTTGHTFEHGCKKVIGEFICDRIDEFHAYELEPSKSFYDIEKARLDLFLKESCLSYNEVCNYRKNLPYFKPLYAWHISDLKIYEKPKELSEFKKYYECSNNSCGSCDKCDKDYHLTRPPQSWCYVED